MKLSNQTFIAAAYLRLSKEDAVVADAKKAESDSISNQKSLIKNFVKDYPDIKIAEYYVDDGYTGVVFERPAFQRMLSDISDGKINCVIVKDLSRFGREYINAGKYMQKMFPNMGVRFIAVNDNYDSLNCDDQTQGIVLSIKNLMNDNYCRDTSIKIRSILEAKRQNGDFVTNFCPYGYKKCADNHNKIEVDEFSGAVVQDIFKWLLDGFSLYKIAEKLNAMGIKTPMDYRLEKGEKINTHFKKNEIAEWSHNIVRRIAENPVYIGTLIQGKSTTPNYKLKKNIVIKDMEEWAIVENNHEPLIDERIFYVVQRLLRLDMRTSPKQDKLYTFSGLLFCGDCGAPMTRKVSTVGSKIYAYYMCSNHKNNKSCTSHRIREDILENNVLAAVRDCVAMLIDAEVVIKKAENLSSERIDIKKMQERIDANKAVIHKLNSDLAALYLDYKDGMFEQKEFIIIKNEFETKKAAAEKAVEQIMTEMEKVRQGDTDRNALINEFKKYKNITKLSRAMAVSLINKINVFEEKKIEILFDCNDALKTYLEQAKDIKQAELSKKEAV